MADPGEDSSHGKEREMAVSGVHHHDGTMVPLRDSAMTLADRAEDVRGRRVVDRNDLEIGWVNELELDATSGEIGYLDVTHGWFFGHWSSHELIPVEEILDVDEETVYIDRAGGEHPDAPVYHPALAKRTGRQERHGLRRFMPL
jgi:sporulation protein YlmC with PRC-barrel domain